MTQDAESPSSPPDSSGAGSRILVLPPRPARRASRPSGSVPLIVIGACVLLGIAIVIVAALMIERWNAETFARRADKPRPTEAARVDPPIAGIAPPRPIPVRDRAKAGHPARGNPGPAFGPDSYPAEAIRAGEQGRVVARLAIDRTGTPRDCTVVTSSGSRSLDAATCAIALANVRYEPARDEDGDAIESSVTLPVRWVLPDDSALGSISSD